MMVFAMPYIPMGLSWLERVLKNADRAAEKQPSDRIAPAHAEINRNQQRQINKLRPAAVLVKKSLEHQRKRHTSEQIAPP